jgi:hypothetical protein
MALKSSWSDWFLHHISNDAGNQNLQAFSNTLSANDDKTTKLQQVTEDIDTIILAAGPDKRIMILHSPLVCMLGLGPQAVSVIVDLESALRDCIIIVPTVD